MLDIQKRLFEYIVGALKAQYGMDKKAWWVKGIPARIRADCSKRWEEKDRDGDEEGQLYMQNYIDICLHNWDLVGDVVALDAKDKQDKKGNTKWIRRLNDIRNQVTHPERGALDTEQVSVVRTLYEKVNEYFPSGLSSN